MSGVSTDVIRRVFIASGEACIEVGPYLDDPSYYLELRTSGSGNVDWFGAINLPMSPDFANALGRALIASSEEMNAK